MNFFGPLRQHQIHAVDLALRSPEKGFALFLPMGVGKTRTTLKIKVDRNSPHPMLVACPKTVIGNWTEEAALVSDLRVVELTGDAKRRRKLLKRPADVYVINFEGLDVLQDELLAMEWGEFVADESHRLANRTTTQSKIAMKLAQRAEFVLELTGTPVRNDARDLWHQIAMIDGGKRLGEKFFGFQVENFLNVSKTRIPNWVPRKGSEEKIRTAIADVCFTVKKSDALPDLPPKLYSKRLLTMTEKQITAYVDMAEEAIATIERGGEAVARNMLTKYIRLHQIAQGFLEDDDDKTIRDEYEPNPKTKELLSILEEHDGKAVVWCQYRHTIVQLMKILSEKGYGPMALYGDTTKNATEIVKRFRDEPSMRVLIGQPQAGGVGVNLIAADLAVYYTNSWSHVERAQSEDRCHRDGSQVHERINYVDLICRGTIDTKILTALSKKKEISDTLTDFREHLYELTSQLSDLSSQNQTGGIAP